MRWQFADANNIEEPLLRSKLWTADETTGIMIDSVTRWRPEISEKRPALLVRPGKYAGHQLSLGNAHHGYLPLTGEQFYSRLMVGATTVFCIAGESAEAEMLGYEVYNNLVGFSDLLRERLRLHRFVIMDLDGIAKVREASDKWVVPINIAHAGEETWMVLPHAPYLKSITIEPTGAE